MGYKKPFIPPKVTATCNILNHTLIYSISLLASIVVYHHLCSKNMSTNGSPPKRANMAHLGGLFGKQQCREDNSESSENSSRTPTGKDSSFGKQTKQYQPAHTFDNHTQHLVSPSFPLFGGEQGFTSASLHTFCLCPHALASVFRCFKALFTTQHRHRSVVYPATCHSMFYASYRSLQHVCGCTST